jgi:hypothetical protein
MSDANRTLCRQLAGGMKWPAGGRNVHDPVQAVLMQVVLRRPWPSPHARPPFPPIDPAAGHARKPEGRIVGLIAKQTGARPRPVNVAGADAAFAIAAPGAVKRVVLARGQGRVAVAHGAPSACAALSSGAELSDGFRAADEIVGDDIEPALLLSVADGDPARRRSRREDADFDKALPYLESLDVITSGEGDGDRLRSRVAVTLK